MPVSGGGFEQCYNTQAVVAEGSLLVFAGDVVQAANDKLFANEGADLPGCHSGKCQGQSLRNLSGPL
jgi:hypothetical protein